MKDTSKELVEAIKNNKESEAKTILKRLLRKKTAERVSKVVGDQ